MLLEAFHDLRVDISSSNMGPAYVRLLKLSNRTSTDHYQVDIGHLQ